MKQGYVYIDFDNWEYFIDEKTGVGVVVNSFYEEEHEQPQTNVYIVPKDKVGNNDWHSDMYEINKEGA
tara:strand:- start:422 stop:625 length:204 start_codon:yes stop_codon:yes gene_type:complete